MNGDTGGVNLHVRGIGHIGALTVALDGSGAVATHRVGGEEVGVAVAAGGNHHSVGGEALELAGYQILGNDAAGTAVDDDDILHLVAGEELHLTLLHLLGQAGVSTQKELLAGLALGVESTAHLSAAKRTVVQHAAVFAGERNTLGHTLVDDVVADLGQTVNVGLTGTIVAALHGVVEETVNAVAVVLVVFGSIDTTLCGNGVCATGRVLNAKVIYVEAHLGQRRGGAGACQSGAHNDDVELQFVLGVDEALVSLIVSPLLSDRSLGDS